MLALFSSLYRSSQCFEPKRSPNLTVLTDSEWQSIKTPALYIIGENDKLYSAKKALQRLKKVVPQVQTVLIPEAGHDLFMIQSDMVVAKVLEFLRQ